MPKRRTSLVLPAQLHPADCNLLVSSTRPVLQALGSNIEVRGATVVAIFGRFLYVFSASLIVGLVFGLGTAILLKVLKSHSAPQVRCWPFWSLHAVACPHRCVRLQAGLPCGR